MKMRSHVVTFYALAIACGHGLLAPSAALAQGPALREGSAPPPLPSADGDASVASPSRAAAEPPPAAPLVVSAEAGGGQSRPAPALGTSSFFYQRASGRYAPTKTLQLAATFRVTEDLARSPDPGSTYPTKGDVVLYGAMSASCDVTEHLSLTLGFNGSPSSRRDVGTSVLTTAPNGSQQSIDATVRAESSSVGSFFEIGYDTANDDGPAHDADLSIDVSAAVTRFATTQDVLAPSAAATDRTNGSLVQARLGASPTVTIRENTELSLDVGYFVYDVKNPGDVGLFNGSTATGLTTSFGAGLPMLPPRFTLRPELAERFGRVRLSAYYQYSDVAVDNATGHTVGGRAQIAIQNVKLFAVASYRADVFPDATAATWTVGLGASLRL